MPAGDVDSLAAAIEGGAAAPQRTADMGRQSRGDVDVPEPRDSDSFLIGLQMAWPSRSVPGSRPAGSEIPVALVLHHHPGWLDEGRRMVQGPRLQALLDRAARNPIGSLVSSMRAPARADTRPCCSRFLESNRWLRLISDFAITCPSNRRQTIILQRFSDIDSFTGPKVRSDILYGRCWNTFRSMSALWMRLPEC